jgi:hypothetical protein
MDLMYERVSVSFYSIITLASRVALVDGVLHLQGGMAISMVLHLEEIPFKSSNRGTILVLCSIAPWL